MSLKSTHQKAEVQIVNHTGHNWLSVSLVHKYSDKYKNKEVWENIPIGASTPPAIVDYNTGVTETGLDWWFVSWVTDEGNTYVTDPHNFGKARDFLERGTKKEIDPLADYAKDALPSVAGAVVGSLIEPGGGTVVGAMAGALAEPAIQPLVEPPVDFLSKLAHHVLNGEPTAGFKEHVLRAKDSKRPTKIIITPNQVEFNSASGISRTRFRKIRSAAPASA